VFPVRYEIVLYIIRQINFSLQNFKIISFNSEYCVHCLSCAIFLNENSKAFTNIRNRAMHFSAYAIIQD
jgi:hypothetical protein